MFCDFLLKTFLKNIKKSQSWSKQKWLEERVVDSCDKLDKFRQQKASLLLHKRVTILIMDERKSIKIIWNSQLSNFTDLSELIRNFFSVEIESDFYEFFENFMIIRFINYFFVGQCGKQ